MADSYRHKAYIRSNYRRSSKFDYGDVEAILNKTFTYSTSVYYTAFGNVFNDELGNSTAICSARVAWLNEYAGTHKYTSVVGAAKNQMSYLQKHCVYITFTTSDLASMLIYIKNEVKLTTSIMAGFDVTVATEATFFVVSR